MTALTSNTIAQARAIAKAYLGIDASDTTQDTRIDTYVMRANGAIENYLGYPVEPVAGTTFTYRAMGDGSIIPLPRLDVDAILEVKVNGAVVPSSCYVLGQSCVHLDGWAGPAGFLNTYEVTFSAGGQSANPLLIEALGAAAVRLYGLIGIGPQGLDRGPVASVNIPNLYQISFRDPRDKAAMSQGGRVLPPEVIDILDSLKPAAV